MFNKVHDQRSPPLVAEQVLLEVRDWRLAGLGVGGLDLSVRVTFLV